MIDVKQFYEYWREQIDNGEYDGISINYDPFGEDIAVYLSDKDHDYRFLGFVTVDGEFDQNVFIDKCFDENPETYNKWIKEIIKLALIKRVYQEILSPDLFKIYTNEFGNDDAITRSYKMFLNQFIEKDIT